MAPKVERTFDPIAYALEQSAEAFIPPREPRAIQPDFFPGYSVVREVHRGGQGVVYEAWQRFPHRRVAIKALRDGFLAGPLDRERFRREIQFLAKLKHPSVVEVFDAGETGTHPFFVMEYVDGQALDDYMADRRSNLSVEEILALFTSICDALSAAHLRGIVHRDLKPSNILVDSGARPRVLDFGLSRITGQAWTQSQPALTLTGQFVGSLLWASPEQAEGDSDRIDVRTDVYALGLILFHMLTGRFPYDVTGSMGQVLDTIRSEEPQKPSAFRRDIEDDLDRIVLRCLSKEPPRRYQSVGDLSRDLARYTRHEPIEAKRDSTWYVLRKVVRRHRIATVSVVATLAFAVIYAGSVTYLYRKARIAESQALQAATQAREFFTSAHSTATFAVQQIAEKLKDLPGASKVRRELLEASYVEFERLFAHQTDNPELLADLAVAKIKLSDLALSVGDNDRARQLRTEALAVRQAQADVEPDNWKKQADLSINLVLIGDLDKVDLNSDSTRKHYERAWAIDEALHAKHPEVRTLLDNLAYSYVRLGDLSLTLGEVDTARSFFERQLAAGQELLRRDSRDASAKKIVLIAHLQLSYVADHLWNAEARLEHLRKAQSVLAELSTDDQHSKSFLTHSSLVACGIGSCLDPDSEADKEERRRAFDDCIRFTQPLYEAEPEDIDLRISYAVALFNLVQLATNRGDWTDALTRQLKVVELRESVVRDDPDKHSNVAGLIQAHSDLAMIHRKLANLEQRERSFARMRELYPSFRSKGVDNPREAGMFQTFCNDEHRPAGLCDPKLALQVARHGVTVSGGKNPGRYAELAVALIRMEQYAEAVVAVDKALELMHAGESPLRGVLEETRRQAQARLQTLANQSPKLP